MDPALFINVRFVAGKKPSTLYHMSLTNKRIILGITGGIAAYKSADLVRRLRDAGAEVRVVMTQAATEFITPLTLQAVSGHPVYRDWRDADTGSPGEKQNTASGTDDASTAGMEHIDLARWADAVLVAPASANFLAKLATGRADNLLSTICLATTAIIAAAPAMNQQMWNNVATQKNLTTLRTNRIHVFGPAQGSQACGEIGPGRMSEPTDQVTDLSRLFETGELDRLKVVVTAGPTWEALDPVRVLTNRSSGKMGYAVAQAAVEAGARVTLVSGPSSLPDPERVTTIRVVSAQEMFDAVHQHVEGADIFIGAAAVSDYRPAHPAKQKSKKRHGETMMLELLKNPDIVESIANVRPAPFVVGFAAETEDLEKNARAKLEGKKLDLVAANLVGIGTGIGTEDNRLLLVDRSGVLDLPPGTKTQLARALVHQIAIRFRAGTPRPIDTADTRHESHSSPNQTITRKVHR